MVLRDTTRHKLELRQNAFLKGIGGLGRDVLPGFSQCSIEHFTEFALTIDEQRFHERAAFISPEASIVVSLWE